MEEITDKKVEAVGKLAEMFLLRVPSRMLVGLLDSKKCVAKVGKDANCTYSHIAEVIRRLGERGLISVEKNERVKVVELTEHGTKIAKLLKSLVEALGGFRGYVYPEIEKLEEKK